MCLPGFPAEGVLGRYVAVHGRNRSTETRASWTLEEPGSVVTFMISLKGIVRRHAYKVFANSVSMITYQSLAPAVCEKNEQLWLQHLARYSCDESCKRMYTKVIYPKLTYRGQVIREMSKVLEHGYRSSYGMRLLSSAPMIDTSCRCAKWPRQLIIKTSWHWVFSNDCLSTKMSAHSYSKRRFQTLTFLFPYCAE